MAEFHPHRPAHPSPLQRPHCGASLSRKVCTPQCPSVSPVLSPALSIIYLLQNMGRWQGASLSMYVGGGVASSSRRPTHGHKRPRAYEKATNNWLIRAGLSIEPNKSLFSLDGGGTQIFSSVTSSCHRVASTQHVRYLGFFFSSGLS